MIALLFLVLLIGFVVGFGCGLICAAHVNLDEVAARIEERRREREG